ncbi:MAG: nicotinate-nicotinamide nucleotide adenylyltransferase [Kofleriaceae bacterium]|nr:nicotinate-nicotinamide nucleotide adenylyltransferase [Kofleriaceae bacterium]
MRTVGLFGGSFDPPHVAHVMAAQQALAQLDEVWFVPVYVHPRGKRLARYADRVAMCELAIAALGPRARVSCIEQELGPCVTLDVLDHLMPRHRETSWRLVLGADLARAATGWRGWNEVASRAPPIVIAREDSDLSATKIRAVLALRAFDLAAAALPGAVLRYIMSRGLYA